MDPVATQSGLIFDRATTPASPKPNEQGLLKEQRSDGLNPESPVPCTTVRQFEGNINLKTKVRSKYCEPS